MRGGQTISLSCPDLISEEDFPNRFPRHCHPSVPRPAADPAVFPAEVPVVSAVGPAAVLFSIQTLKGFVLGGN